MKLIIDIPEEKYNEIEPFLNGKEIKGGFNLFQVLEIIKNGIPLDNVKAEIQKALDEDKATDTENAKVQAIALMWCLEIIDKYIGEQNDKNR